MKEAPLVYSTHPDFKVEPKIKEKAGLPELGQKIKARLEKNQRGGKEVTVLFEIKASENQLRELGKVLRKQLGVGGTVKAGRVELQGNKIIQVIDLLKKMGYQSVKAGG
jgi:translation initiation factor 1